MGRGSLVLTGLILLVLGAYFFVSNGGFGPSESPEFIETLMSAPSELQIGDRLFTLTNSRMTVNTAEAGSLTKEQAEKRLTLELTVSAQGRDDFPSELVVDRAWVLKQGHLIDQLSLTQGPPNSPNEYAAWARSAVTVETAAGTRVVVRVRDALTHVYYLGASVSMLETIE